MAPATAEADCVRTGISRKSIESAATASPKNCPPARAANADGKRRRETEAHFWRGETRDAAAAGDRGSRGTVTQSPDFGCERSPERLIGSPRVTKWPSNSAALNLPLAARPRVGHIGLTGDVAEWLKAAVC